MTAGGAREAASPWLTSFSSSSMGFMCVLGQNSRSAWSNKPPRFTRNKHSVLLLNVSMHPPFSWHLTKAPLQWRLLRRERADSGGHRALTLRVGTIRTGEPCVLSGDPRRETVTLIQGDCQHLDPSETTGSIFRFHNVNKQLFKSVSV